MRYYYVHGVQRKRLAAAGDGVADEERQVQVYRADRAVDTFAGCEDTRAAELEGRGAG